MRLTYLSVYDRRDRNFWSHTLFCPPLLSLTNVHNIQTPTLSVPTLLTFTCTQILWFLSRLTRSRASCVTTRPDTRITIISTLTTQCMWVVTIKTFEYTSSNGRVKKIGVMMIVLWTSPDYNELMSKNLSPTDLSTRGCLYSWSTQQRAHRDSTNVFE